MAVAHSPHQVERLLLLLLFNDNAPLMLLVAVHDIMHPAFQFESKIASLAGIAHADGDINTTVVDVGHGADEEL